MPRNMKPGIRMKGGVLYDSEADGFRAVVHAWNNIQCQGEPEEWLSDEIFPTENEAMAHYKANIQPCTKKMMSEFLNTTTDAIFIHRELE